MMLSLSRVAINRGRRVHGVIHLLATSKIIRSHGVSALLCQGGRDISRPYHVLFIIQACGSVTFKTYTWRGLQTYGNRKSMPLWRLRKRGFA